MLLLFNVLPTNFGIHQWIFLMMISYFPHSMCIYYLEFFCKKELFLLYVFIYSTICLYHYGLMGIVLLFG